MDKEQIINFTLNNDNLEKLKARVNRFNPLKVLKVQDQEIRHSNILAWLFNPKENHNLDDRILKRFILKVLLKPENEEVLDDMNMVYDFQQWSLLDVDTYRELEHIDIVLVSKKNGVVIIIENKVYSGEHSNQLKRYYDLMQSKYSGDKYKLVPIFLTLEGKEPSHKKYFSASYSDVLETIEFVIKNYKNRTTDDVAKFIKYYLRILKEKYVMDDKLKKMCKDIYGDNKEVIDMIYSVGNEIDIESAIELFKKKHDSLISVALKPRSFGFVLKEFEASRIGELEGWDGFPIVFWFSEYSKKLKLVLYVGPFADPKMRIRFLETLEEQNIKIRSNAKQVGRQYSIIYTDTLLIKDWTDEEELNEGMENLFNKNKVVEIIPKVFAAITNMNWER